MNSTLPAVSGQAVQGQTVSTSNGSWSGSPTSYAYQWQDCNSSGGSCANISGATSSAYVLQPGDVGSTVRSVVTATNAGGSASASSAAMAVVASGGGGGGGGSFACPAAVHCYYISYTSGSDSYTATQAQSKATPWKTAPGMANATGHSGYLHAAGDEFIFEGGDTWPNASLPLVPVGSGNSSTSDYYGVDPSWFIGGSFTRPKFDAQNTDINSGGRDVMVNLNGADYVTLDDIELENFRGDSNTSTTYGNCTMISTATDQHIVLTRLYMHSVYAVKGLDCYMVKAADYSPFAGSSVLENSALISDNTAYMTGVKGFGNVENNEIGGMYNLVFPEGHGQISGNLLHDCADVGTGSPTDGGTSTGLHNNAIESLMSNGAFYIHDNVIHDTTVPMGTDNECESMIIGNAGETDYVYNNVLYNINGNSPTVPQNAPYPGTAAFFWNNTIETGRIGGASPVESCVKNNNTSQPLTVENNLCITTATSDIQGSGTADHNVRLTPTNAVNAGFLTSNYYADSQPAGASTSGAGVNLSSNCGAVAGLCSDTGYAGLRTPIARPSAGTSWDVGAYRGSAGTLIRLQPDRTTVSHGRTPGPVSARSTGRPSGPATDLSERRIAHRRPTALQARSWPPVVRRVIRSRLPWGGMLVITGR